LAAGASIEVTVRHQSGAASEITDLFFEVLDLIKISRPMGGPLPGAGFAAQVGGIAQTFAHAGEIPDAAIVAAIIVTGRTAASSFSKCELSSPAGALSIITPGANVKPSHYRWNAVNSGGFGGLAPHFHNKSEATKIFKC
jgi:hypothetical protein